MPKSVTPVKTPPKVAVKRPVQSPVFKGMTKPVVKPVEYQKVSKRSVTKEVPKDIAKPKKAKVVRDSFTMPQSEYELIAAIKKRCIAKGLAAKKSEVLRAAIVGFAAQSDDYIKAALGSLEVIKTGRPSGGKK